MRQIILLLTLFLPLAACSAATSTPAPSETPVILPQETAAPTSTSAAQPIQIPAHEKYVINVDVDYDAHSLTAEEIITYPNHTGAELRSLTLAIAANLWPGTFLLRDVTVDGAPVANYSLNGHRLDIPLPTPLAPASVSTVSLRFGLSLPYMDQVNSQRARIFGYSDVQMNLVNWYPFVAPYINGEWVIREPWSHGEYLVYPLADFEVNVKLAQAANPPVVASSGFAEPNGEYTKYTLENGRSFALSLSREFQVASLQVGTTTVSSYYLPIYTVAGQAALSASAQALQVFSQKFGEYAHKSLSIVMADFKDSMEFSGLFFHSRSFYDLYGGTPRDYLTIVAVHETGHQWWFDQVANDQAREPWLDESLTTYSELIYYETVDPSSPAWWWSYRIDYFQPHGKIDIPVYDGGNADEYKYIVYFNGAHFLQDLRARLGDESFFAFLKDYYTQSRGRIVTADDFFRVLDERTDVDYADIVEVYFRSR